MRQTSAFALALATALSCCACVGDVEGLSHASLMDCALEGTGVFVPAVAGMTRAFAPVSDGCMRYQTTMSVRDLPSITTAYCNRCDVALALDVLHPRPSDVVSLDEQLERSVGTSLIVLEADGAVLPGSERICTDAEPSDAPIRQILPPHSSALYQTAEVRIDANPSAAPELILVYPRLRSTSSIREASASGSLKRLCEAAGQVRVSSSDAGRVPDQFRALDEFYFFEPVGVLILPSTGEGHESSEETGK